MYRLNTLVLFGTLISIKTNGGGGHYWVRPNCEHIKYFFELIVHE